MARLTAAVLASVREVSAQVRENRDAFVSRLSGIGEKQKRQKTEAARKERGKADKRLADIGLLVKKAFEQNTSGKLPDDLYAEMMDGYKQERASLTARLDTLNAVIAEADRESTSIDEFVGLIARYIDVQELNKVIVHELIEKIVVHQAQRIDGQRKQQIDIYYRFIGIVE